MKKYLFCMAAFAAVLVSCKKESFKDNNSDGKVHMTVTASAVDTKTFVSTEDGVTYTPSWSAGDAIHVLEFIDGVLSQEANSSALDANSQEASFSVPLEPKDAGNFKYYAVYPADSYSVSTGENKFYRLQLPENQTFTADSFGAGSDLLISGPMAVGLEAQPSELNLKFKRIGSAARITVNGMAVGEKIASVKISTTEGYISGYSKYDPTTGVWEGTYASSKKSISLTPSPDQTYVTDGSDDIWVRLYPITISENLSIEITTDKAIYSKTINPSASGRTIEFADGGLTTFSVSGLQREPLSVVPDGEYVIAANYTTNNTYHALSCVASTTRLSMEDITANFSSESYSGDNYDIVWKITTTDSGSTIQSLVESKYLTNGDKAASVADAKVYYTLKADDSGQYSITPVNETSYGLRYNASSKYFAFYNSVPNISMIGSFYLIPANIDKTPVITLDKSSDTVSASADQYEISFTSRFLTGAVTVKLSDEDGIINGDPVVSDGKITLALNKNLTSEQKTATISICSEADGVEEPFVLTQEQYATNFIDEITATTAGHTSSSYTSWSNKSKTTENSGIKSDAVYAGKTCYNSSKEKSIQMNSNSGYGIWTTASGGVFESIAVDYADANSKTITVYGQNEPFANGVYSNATEIGTLSASNLTLDSSSDYEYILLRASGATYVKKFTITWKAKAAATGISVVTAPSQLEYHKGESFDPTGLVINVTYEDGTNEDVAYSSSNASRFTFTPSGALAEENTSIDITYKEQGVAQPVNVYTWAYDSLVGDAAPSKTIYWEGESFDASGMTAHAHYIDNKPGTPNEKDDVASSSGLTYSKDALVAGTTSITISKTIDGVTKSFEQPITVNVRPVFTVVAADGQTGAGSESDPIQLANTELDVNPISVTAGEDVSWTVSLVSGDGEEFMFTDSGTGSGDINVMVTSNTGIARTFKLTISSTADGLLTKSYDMYLVQARATTIKLPAPEGLTYSNSAKSLSWKAVTKDVNGAALEDFTPSYQISIDGGEWIAVEGTSYSVSDLEKTTHTARIKTASSISAYSDSDATADYEFKILDKSEQTVLTENFTNSSATNDTYGCNTSLSSTLTCDYKWTSKGSGTVFQNGIKLGSSNKTGSVSNSTMLTDIPVGTVVTVKVYAAVWGTDGGSVKLTYNSNSETLSPVAGSISSPNYVSYDVNSFLRSTDFKITIVSGQTQFTVGSSSKRILIDKIEVVY